MRPSPLPSNALRGGGCPLPSPSRLRSATQRSAHDLRQVNAQQLDRLPDGVEESVQTRHEAWVDLVFCDQVLVGRIAIMLVQGVDGLLPRSRLGDAKHRLDDLLLHVVRQLLAEADRVAGDVADGGRPDRLEDAYFLLDVGELTNDAVPRVPARLPEGRACVHAALVDGDDDAVMAAGEDRLAEEGVGVKALFLDVNRRPDVAGRGSGGAEGEALALQVGDALRR